ncbi:MAG: ankyrin repeat domain-containing protein, partial [Candidatus Eisenbacteria bacterium]|nr:ankyrin repeat domain-containing protein [Candidatus Eisenbacteria bacterium]
ALRVLVEAGADPDLRDDRNGWSPLLHAVHKNQLVAVKTLLALGADPDLGGRGGYTPLMMAAGYGYPEIARELLSHGADPRRCLRNGENALMMAATGALDLDRFTLGSCQAETVRLLLERDPGLVLPDTPLGRVEKRFLRVRGCDDVLALLRGHGID